MSANGFPRRLREQRQRLFWSQIELARQTGVDVRTISRWETGKSAPLPGSWQLRRVAEVMRMSPSVLRYGEERHAND